MIHTEKQGFVELLKISFPYIIFSTLYTLLVLGLEEFLGDHIYKISGQIGSVFGLAVAFFLGFRMNSAYDRWWEARKIFGELTNNTRSFVTKLYVYYGNKKNLNESYQPISNPQLKELILLTIHYVRQIKNEIKENNPSPGDKEKADLFLKYGIDQQAKITQELLIAISGCIELNFQRESRMEKSDLMQHINRFYDIQGKAERIKNTPFLKIYAAFTKIIVSFYVVLIPLFIGDIDLGGEESGFEFLAAPIMAIISTAFLTINKLANLYGQPFSKNKTSVTVEQIIHNIEQDCRQILVKIKD
jgi:putative membrane protein